MMTRRLALAATAFATILTVSLGAQNSRGAASIQPGALKEWLTYIASDELEGRRVYTEGLGLAAAYIADHLKEWGLKPGGDDGSYFQTVKVRGVRTTSRSSITVTVNGQSRTFKDGEGIVFPRNMGGQQTIDGSDIVFVGYGLQLPAANLDDYANESAKGKIVVWMGPQGPKNLPQGSNRLLNARSRNALEKGAIAVIAPQSTFGRGGGGQGRGDQAAGRGAQPATDFSTVQRYDRPVPPTLTAQDEFLEFLFSGSDVKYAALKELATKQEALPRFAIKNAKISIGIDPEYSVVNTQLTRNVIGIVEGSDPQLKDTYVLFGAHYDHSGYLPAPPTAGGGRGFGGPPGGCVGQTRPTPREGDVINNGADDDGSGTVGLMAVARAFAQGPKPKRSVIFVWHTAEESGLLGSRYNADYPAVPNDKIVTVLNIDMIGRNRCDQESEANTVYLVGSDRISTELHNISEDVNASQPKPLKLDYEFNDPADPESIYTRSDHYSYASKGIPIIFYTTGLHKDYHYVTDEVDKIEFDKLARISQLVYATGFRVANADKAPERDNKGPRAGKGTGGKLAR
jgi:hypothetical protein